VRASLKSCSLTATRTLLGDTALGVRTLHSISWLAIQARRDVLTKTPATPAPSNTLLRKTTPTDIVLASFFVANLALANLALANLAPATSRCETHRSEVPRAKNLRALGSLSNGPL
jgi:hypothetical protein